jgi:hypothetical protein
MAIEQEELVGSPMISSMFGIASMKDSKIRMGFNLDLSVC